MSKYQAQSIQRDLEQDDLIVITGAGGFIGGSLVRYFHDLGYTRIRAVDKKPFENWYQHIPGVEDLQLDLSQSESCMRAVEGAREVYNLAADMGGMGFIERFRVECMRADQHAYARSRLSGRGQSILLFLFGLRL
jgi:GDP-D-mannose 3',5'-epimerase